MLTSTIGMLTKGHFIWGVAVYRGATMLTIGVFHTRARAEAWSTATLKLYSTLPEAEAEKLEGPDDWDLAHAH